MIDQKYKKPIILSLLVGCLVLVFVVVFNNIKFHLKNVKPSGNSTNLEPIIFMFNKDVKIDAEKQFIITPKINGKTTVSKNIIKFTPLELYKDNTRYTATIKEVTSLSGSKLKNVSTVFNIVYIPYSKLSAEAKTLQNKATDSVEKGPEIFKKLPHVDNGFSIEYFSYGSGSGLTYVFNVKLETVYSKSPQYSTQNQLITLKKQAINWLNINGIDQVKHETVFYPDPDLNTIRIFDNS